MTRRALIYTRQSHERPEGNDSLSIVSQVEALTARCQREGWRITHVIRETGLRGWLDADDRPGLDEALTRAQTGEYDVLLVWDLSRLARSVWLQEGIVRQLQRAGVELVSHTEPHAANAMIRQIVGAVAEERTRDLARTMRRVLRQKQASGLHHGVVPWGYVRPDPQKPLAPDPATAPLVAEVFAMRAAGRGAAAIADALTGRGVLTPRGHPWPIASVLRMLGCVTYRGAVVAGDAVIEDAHPAIVDAETWQAAQGRRRAPRRKRAASWLEGSIEHGCGQPMYLVAPSRSNPSPAFRCRHASAGMVHARQPACPLAPRSLRASCAEALAWQRIAADLEAVLDPEAVLAEAQERYRTETPAGDAARRAAEGRRQRAGERRARAESLYLSGARDRAWFDAEDALADAEATEAERTLRALPAPPDANDIAAAWQGLRDVREALGQFGSEERAEALRALGVAVVVPAGIRGRNGKDPGAVVIRYAPELAPFFPATKDDVDEHLGEIMAAV